MSLPTINPFQHIRRGKHKKYEYSFQVILPWGYAICNSKLYTLHDNIKLPKCPTSFMKMDF